MGKGGIFTIGHSTHPVDKFIDLLKQHNIDVVADVRSSPFSSYNPQFNQKTLANNLRLNEIKYGFFGRELGARSEDTSCYIDGKVQFSRLSESQGFKTAIERLLKGSIDHRIVLMCSEKDPLDCHRTILVAQTLVKLGSDVGHIHHDGSLEQHTAALDRLLDLTGIPKSDLFKSQEELFAEALDKQESRIAYQTPSMFSSVD